MNNTALRNFLVISAAVIMGSQLALPGQVKAATIAVVPIPVKATYLHVDATDAGYGVFNTIPINLADIGVSAGDVLLLEALGDFKRGTAYVDDFKLMNGVFSASDVLLAQSQLHRVQDAIDAGDDITSSITYYRSDATDIAEDFRIFHETDITQTIIRVPEGAQYLFVAAHDSLYSDNTDPDNDFAVRVSAVPLPASIVIFGSGFATLLGFKRKRA